MNNLRTFPGNISTSKANILASVLVTSVLIPLIVNLLFQSVLFTGFVENKSYFVLTGLLIYGIWLAILFFLFRNDTIRLKELTITKQKFKTGLLAGSYIFIAVNLLFLAFSLITYKKVIISEDFGSIGSTFKIFGLFVFNIIIGAFIEELIFRAYLIPQVFLRINNKLSNSAISLVITVLITEALFAISHIPRDLFRNNYDLSTISNDVFYLFTSGIIYSIIFLWTKNIFFVTIFHGFMNFPLSVINSPSWASFNFYSIVITVIIALLWYKIIEPKGRKGRVQVAATL